MRRVPAPLMFQEAAPRLPLQQSEREGLSEREYESRLDAVKRASAQASEQAAMLALNHSMKNMGSVDEVVFGRDLDGSNSQGPAEREVVRGRALPAEGNPNMRNEVAEVAFGYKTPSVAASADQSPVRWRSPDFGERGPQDGRASRDAYKTFLGGGMDEGGIPSSCSSSRRPHDPPFAAMHRPPRASEVKAIMSRSNIAFDDYAPSAADSDRTHWDDPYNSPQQSPRSSPYANRASQIPGGGFGISTSVRPPELQPGSYLSPMDGSVRHHGPHAGRRGASTIQKDGILTDQPRPLSPRCSPFGGRSTQSSVPFDTSRMPAPTHAAPRERSYLSGKDMAVELLFDPETHAARKAAEHDQYRRTHIQHGHQSNVDEVVFGRDLDDSGGLSPDLRDAALRAEMKLKSAAGAPLPSRRKTAIRATGNPLNLQPHPPAAHMQAGPAAEARGGGFNYHEKYQDRRDLLHYTNEHLDRSPERPPRRISEIGETLSSDRKDFQPCDIHGVVMRRPPPALSPERLQRCASSLEHPEAPPSLRATSHSPVHRPCGVSPAAHGVLARRWPGRGLLDHTGRTKASSMVDEMIFGKQPVGGRLHLANVSANFYK